MTDSTQLIKVGLKKRYAKERRFHLFGLISILISFSFLFVLLFSIAKQGLPAFQQTYIKLDLFIDPVVLGVTSKATEEALFEADYFPLILTSLKSILPKIKGRKQRRALKKIISKSARYDLRDDIIKNPQLIGTTITRWVLAKDEVDILIKNPDLRQSPIKSFQLAWVDQLAKENRIALRFNRQLFQASDSREPEQAGLKGALMGSFYTLLVTLALAFPMGVASAAYLEEFAPKNNRWVDFIEININNLAAVPSIVFGLLGLAVFINLLGVPRSTPLIGGLVLTLMTLPTIIISSRAAIRAVSPALKEAAIGLGASKMQTLFHHTLPISMPGILTGTIIGMAQALGETAPLLMIGMVAFVADVPHGFTDPATVMPVQIYLWSDTPERAFTERTSAAIMVLLAFLIAMNLIAIILRKHFEQRMR